MLAGLQGMGGVSLSIIKPLKLLKMGLTQDNKCWKCNNEAGIFLHPLWECPKVQPFWKEVLKNLEGWLKQPLPESPQLCLLEDKSLVPPGRPWPGSKQSAFENMNTNLKRTEA